MIDEANWYNHISLIGRVVELQDDEDLSGITGCPGSTSARSTRSLHLAAGASAWIEIDRWHGWGEHKENTQPG
ncbi:PPOX class F420-dependent enzyme OS=Streptomyces antimycoticus OX=68175 GN=SANT12839_015600 PE=4 SV=1 [Streptomyces antimycoticus]